MIFCWKNLLQGANPLEKSDKSEKNFAKNKGDVIVINGYPKANSRKSSSKIVTFASNEIDWILECNIFQPEVGLSNQLNDVFKRENWPNLLKIDNVKSKMNLLQQLRKRLGNKNELIAIFRKCLGNWKNELIAMVEKMS